MRERSQAASILLLAMVGCASKPTNTNPTTSTTWYPIPGVSFSPCLRGDAHPRPVARVELGADASRMRPQYDLSIRPDSEAR